MTAVFDETYAGAYDALYADKDYDAECDAIEAAFSRHGVGATRTVLDLGCGTGNHALRLAQRGYDVTGVDRSAPMLAQAREKADAGSLRIRWLAGDVASVRVGAAFDAVLLMFAVLSYQLGTQSVRATLKNARSHLRPGGLLLFDVWHGPGVLIDPPQPRTKTVQTPKGRLVRSAEPTVDVRRHRCSVRYELSLDGEVVGAETHDVRFFFPLELELLLELSGFETLVLAPFADPEGILSADTWSLLGIARAC
jgi:SAM-dependent methyltransferase